MIKRLTERVSPRVFRVVALPAPSDRQKTQIYMQRYIEQLPAAGEVADLRPQLVQPPRRRAGDGLLHRASAAKRFLQEIPHLEALITELGHHCCSSTSSPSARRSRSAASASASTIRSASGSSRRWTSNPTAAGGTIPRAYDEMIRLTDTPHAPWWIVELERQEGGAHQLPHPPPRRRSPTRRSSTTSRSSASARSAPTTTSPTGRPATSCRWSSK